MEDIEDKYIPLDCQQQIDPGSLWFIDNPTGSDVDHAAHAAQIASLEAKERPDESLKIELPLFCVKFESNIFYGSTTTSQSIPLLVATFAIDSELRDWSGDLECNTDIAITSEVRLVDLPGGMHRQRTKHL